MHYVITGATGHTGRPIAEQLLAAGHEVTVIGRSAANLQQLVDKGARAAVGSVSDTAFLTETFRGADAVYTMVPPNMTPSDWKAYIGGIGENFTKAIRAAGVKYVVNLSSVGAHLPEGCGPVSGLYRVEASLNALSDVNILHLRPGFFFYNFLASIDMVRHMHILGGNYGEADAKMVLADTKDIAAVATEALLSLSFKGHTVRYIASDIRTTGEVASVIGKAIGEPGLPWVFFADDQLLGALTGAGLPEEIAKNYVEMGAAIRSGKMQEDYFAHPPAAQGKYKLEAFAEEFAGAYNAVPEVV
jgi:uncharacterized protein YbjT (DUF2867 family)